MPLVADAALKNCIVPPNIPGLLESEPNAPLAVKIVWLPAVALLVKAIIPPELPD